jgi:lipopolysaccharide biosynthesis regulator YciM
VFREWGMLLRDSGDADATDRAIEKFEIALEEMPHDAVAIHALAMMYERKGAYRRVIELLEPLVSHSSTRTRQMTLPVLLKAYERVNEVVKAAELRVRMRDLIGPG